MSATSYGLTTTGFVLKRLEDIKTEMETNFRVAFGAAIELDSASPAGQLIGVLSEREALLWEKFQELYSGVSPDSAVGEALDKLCAVSNVLRLAALPSTFSTANSNPVTVTGSAGTVVPAGFTVAVDGYPTIQFITVEEWTIGTGGTVAVDMECTATGATAVNIGTLTEIVTPVVGVDSVTNSVAATLGRATEIDSALRERRLISLAKTGTATVDGLRNALLLIDGVLQAYVYENVLDVTDGDSLPPHSFEAVISGGTASTVAATIWGSKPAGIQTYGTVTEQVTDSQGLIHDVSFSRPTEKPVYIKITLVKNADSKEGPLYPDGGDDAVKAAVLAYGQETAQIGRDLFANRYFTPINTVAGINGITLEWGFAPESLGTGNLVIGNRELATFDLTHIEVTE